MLKNTTEASSNVNLRNPNLTRIEGYSDQERAEVREKLDRRTLLGKPETRKKHFSGGWNLTN